METARARLLFCRIALALSSAACVAVPAGAALADATVQIRVTDAQGRPLDGTVVLTAGAVRLSCTTTAGRCSMRVAAGAYTASLTVPGSTSPAPSRVTVPAAGTIALSLTAPAPTVTHAPPMRPGTTPTIVTAGRPGTVTPLPIGPGQAATTPSSPPSRPGTPATPQARTATAGTLHTTYAVGSSGRSLASGGRLCVQGSIVDHAGRPADGTITVSQGGSVIGHVSSTAGRFSMYDLPAGSYAVTVAGPSGSASSSMSVGAGLSRVTLRVP